MSHVRRIARSLVFGVRGATARIRFPTFWRALYGLADSRAGIAVLALGARCAGRLSRTDPVTLVDRAVPLFEVGWPHHPGTPWVNLHVQRTHRHVVAALRGARPRPQRQPLVRPRLRVGVLGRLEDAFFFTRRFFDAAPADVDVVAFDLGSASESAREWIEPRVESYASFSLADVAALAAAVDGADVDLLVADVRKPRIYDFLDLVETPCVALLCAEVHLRYHPSVAFHLYPFVQADYFPREGRMFCGTTHDYLGPERIYPVSFPYDTRGLDPAARRGWAEREPLVVFHGRLFKAADAFLDVMFDLLREDDRLRFVLMGQDSHGALDRIRRRAAAAGVDDRVAYEGSFTTVYDASGELADPSWRRLFDLLGRARLAPDPWPLAGGASRVEAYAAGAPTVHMGVDTAREAWGRPQPMVTAEHAALLVPRATAYSVPDYARLCRDVLYDGALADAVAAEQAAIVERVAAPDTFWMQALEAHGHWLGGVREPVQPARSR